MSDNEKLIIRKILIIIGLILISITIIGGFCIVYFGFKFFAGGWLSWWQYILTTFSYAVALLVIAIIGAFSIYVAIDINKEKK